ncbi:DNA internalization-related competence protein ComEC/Rec2 [Desulfobacter hydrogenophilus]|uniref:DNA internalization-related competence protein ComEC/Rec2 n=2 Tax=Desulfobacter hydrogenophilus TaxID=2291 RepID=A0A328FCZ0_9BACT|nr:DNA internalization-related competence protein ComEC/Rec2 [Desulfobacter hydrogenophilus]QBH15691.1 DNA internalization-related competence protein ComEC/Rec2 [Desulfobacter hydrogenophilus]RAM02511.1 DNA internalization-related competence protein ComEC/Rec2 [Desulfobacter hydrogenophilus]
MFFVLLACVTGAIAGSWTPVSLWIFFIAACLPAAIVFILYKPDKFIFIACLAAFGLIMFRMAGICAPDYSDHHVVRFCNGKPHRISGIINSFPKKYQNKTRYTVNCTRINADTGVGELILTVYHDFSKQAVHPLLFGEHIIVTSKIRAIRNFSNPGGYDYKFRMRLKGITGSVYANSRTIVQTGRVDTSSFACVMRFLQRIRDRFSNNVANAAKSKDERQPDFFLNQARAVLTALVTGQKEMIHEKTRDNFSKAGLSHILAVSGLHMSLVGFGFFSIFICILNRQPSYVITGRAKKTAGLLTLLPLTAYAFFVGFSPSTQRALIMAAVFLTSFLMEKEKDPLNTLYFAASLILLIDPGALFSISFQLSFACVFFIITGFIFLGRTLSLPENKWIKRIGLTILTTVFAGIGAAPVTAFYFNMFPMAQVGTNFVMIPIIGFLCLPLGLAGLVSMDFWPGLAHLLLTLDIHILSYCLQVIHWIAGFDWTWARVVTPRPIEIVIYYALILCFGFAIMEKNKRAIYLTFLLIVAGIISTGQGMLKRFYPGKLVVHTLDVGQGNAAVIIAPDGKTLLIDAGGFGGRSSFDTGRYIVGPFLWKNWILELDAVILTHPDSDHMNGLCFIFENFRVRQWIKNHDISSSVVFKNLMYTAEKKGIKSNIIGSAPCRFSWDQVNISILGGKPQHLADNRNNNSLVTRLDFLSFSILFPGDIEEKRERELVHTNNFSLKSNILMAPHHGSCSSSSELFLDKVSPSGVIISCGYMNRHNFPCRTVLQRYRRNRMSVFRTDLMGAVTLQSDGVGYSVEAHRKN